VTDFDLSAYEDLDPAQFATLVKSTPKDQLEAVIDGPHRADLLAAIFNRMPGLFRPDKAGSATAVIQWSITAPAGDPADWFVVIAGGACTVSNDASLSPKVCLTMGGYTFLELVSGTANPVMLVMTGKVKVNGDLATAANIANYFDLPKG
jgi:putative sterol carrier protein